MTTLREIAAGLPNGFHDARVDICTVDFAARTLTFELALWVGDDSDPERYRGARLRVAGLLYCAFDPPDPRYPFAERGPLVVDLCDPDAAIPVNAALPLDAFSARFWVASWNSFIHLAATSAELAWTDAARRDRFFLNVDLDVESSEDLAPLIAALEPHACSMERPPGRASFELNQPVSPTTPEPLVVAFVQAVSSLPPPIRAIWDRAARRTFDIGIQSGRRPLQEAHRLSPETLRLAADVDAEIAVTVYGLSVDDA